MHNFKTWQFMKEVSKLDHIPLGITVTLESNFK